MLDDCSGLPDEAGRLQILRIHTSQMKKEHCLNSGEGIHTHIHTHTCVPSLPEYEVPHAGLKPLGDPPPPSTQMWIWRILRAEQEISVEQKLRVSFAQQLRLL